MGTGPGRRPDEPIRSVKLAALSSRDTMPPTIQDFLSRLRFPYLFLLTAGVFFLDVLVPDLVPFVDEILLGLGTLLLSRLKRNRSDGAG